MARTSEIAEPGAWRRRAPDSSAETVRANRAGYLEDGWFKRAFPRDSVTDADLRVLAVRLENIAAVIHEQSNLDD